MCVCACLWAAVTGHHSGWESNRGPVDRKCIVTEKSDLPKYLADEPPEPLAADEDNLCRWRVLEKRHRVAWHTRVDITNAGVACDWNRQINESLRFARLLQQPVWPPLVTRTSDYFAYLFVISILFFLPGKHRLANKSFGSALYCGRSSSTKPSCSRTNELIPCTATEIDYYRYDYDYDYY